MANLLEGGRRLASSGRFVLKISACIALFGAVLFALSFTDLSLYFPLLSAQGFVLPFAASFCFALFGLALLIAGRVVEGFGLPESGGQRPSDRTSNIAVTNQ